MQSRSVSKAFASLLIHGHKMEARDRIKLPTRGVSEPRQRAKTRRSPQAMPSRSQGLAGLAIGLTIARGIEVGEKPLDEGKVEYRGRRETENSYIPIDKIIEHIIDAAS